MQLCATRAAASHGNRPTRRSSSSGAGSGAHPLPHRLQRLHLGRGDPPRCPCRPARWSCRTRSGTRRPASSTPSPRAAGSSASPSPSPAPPWPAASSRSAPPGGPGRHRPPGTSGRPKWPAAWPGAGSHRAAIRVTGVRVSRPPSRPLLVCCSSCLACRTGRTPRRCAAAATSSTPWS